ncbi:adenylate/guanylate cyclase domain-containing protein [Limnofasciculus baicalensis]|uniref:Response regulator n=1 Tax=Limnofasciculus baicalensis BBK-W-15 TaxID=2699891 RepID=A0AAE3KN89_9CYAN|nr:adenylate/guanylate cyclase domain-containing protein [Limnofasciculus baicalensis]MCP2728398.1 response regulator [Limnofasciculus baicalensis BBK-W-15]
MNKPIIICVDDDHTILDSLEVELQNFLSNEYLIETASSGIEALELLTELLEDNCQIPLVISDHIMPGMKGDELLKRIHEISPKTLKILLTGQADLEAIGNAIKYAKLYRYIAKPWQSADLLLTVKEAVNSYHQEQKLAEQNIELQRMNQVLEQLNREQAQLIAQLHENENRLRQFLEAMPVGVGVLDARGEPYYINQKAKEIYGKGVVPDITAEQLSEVYQLYKVGTNRKYPTLELPIVRALNGEIATADDLEVRQGGKVIPLEVWATPIYDGKGKIEYAINTIQDITERKQAEAERQKFIEELFELNCNLELALEAELELTNAAKQFVPNEFLSLLGHRSLVDVKLGDQVQKEMSVLFSDIRDFTTLSEQLTPQENFKFINEYLSRMEPAILDNKGFIDKYIGDGIMALFSGNADDAVKAGITMVQELTDYNQYRVKSGDNPILIGIGINTGSLMLGTVGGKTRMDGTVISDDVNLASRMEGLTKLYRVSLLISHQTVARLQYPTDYCVRFIEQTKVKGKSKAVAVFEVFDGDDPKIKDKKLATKAVFEEGLFLYYQKVFVEAKKRFQVVLKLNPSDTVAQIYLERCYKQLS